MNVMITSASRKVGLIQAFRESWDVLAVDCSPFSAALYFADDYRVVPRHPECLGALLELCEEYQIDLIVPTRDEEQTFFAENVDEFDATVMVPSLETVRTCNDKLRFSGFCREHGFATPMTYEGLPDKYPAFMKPRWGKGSLGTYIAYSEEDVKPGLIAQEYLEAPEYTVDVFLDFKSRALSVVPRLRIRTFGGESFVGRTEKNWTIMEESVRLAEALGLVGHNTVQCFLDGVVKFIEVNPRYGGGATLGFAAGAHTPTMLADLLSGKEVKPRIGEFEDGLVMLRYTQDFFEAKSVLRSRGDFSQP